LRGDVESFARELNDFLLQSLSVFDATVESNYSMFMAGLLIALHNAYAIQFNNIESGHGRPDGLILPKDSRYHCGFILEYKHLREAEVSLRRKNDKAYLEQKLKSSALEGFEQIDSHRYDAYVRAFPHVKQILQVSLAFYKKRVVIVSRRKILDTMSPGEIELYLPNKPKRIIATPETTETRAEVVPINSAASFFHEHETRAQSRKRTAEQAEISREPEEGAPATKMVHGGKAV